MKHIEIPNALLQHVPFRPCEVAFKKAKNTKEAQVVKRPRKRHHTHFHTIFGHRHSAMQGTIVRRVLRGRAGLPGSVGARREKDSLLVEQR